MLDRPLSFRTGVALLILVLVGLSGLIAYLLRDEVAAPPAKSPLPLAAPAGTRPDAEMADFVGDAACLPCHPTIARLHRNSRHAATLHALGSGPLPLRLPARDRFTDGSTGLCYALERRDGRCQFQVQAPEGPRAATVDYAFGSGKTGVTLVSSPDTESVRELRMSYFPSRNRWEITPGQRAPGDDPLGKLHGRAVSQRCFSCHATVVAASRVLPEPRFLGVGCEACHGPGRAHLEAIRRGEVDRRIDNPGRWDGARVNQLCGRCHRTERELNPRDRFALTQTQRFQPLGLARSACFRGSAGRLSCVTCHDAHANARTDAAHYVAICRSCHAGAPEHVGRTCPVNPVSGCLACHMPPRAVVRGITMADHWIRVNRAAGKKRIKPINKKNKKKPGGIGRQAMRKAWVK